MCKRCADYGWPHHCVTCGKHFCCCPDDKGTMVITPLFPALVEETNDEEINDEEAK